MDLLITIIIAAIAIGVLAGRNRMRKNEIQQIAVAHNRLLHEFDQLIEQNNLKPPVVRWHARLDL